MLAYVQYEVALSKVLDDGSTQRDANASYFRQTGQHYPGWEPRTCPDDLQYLWAYWCDMSERRTVGFSSVNPIPHEGVEAWARRRGIALDPLENMVLDSIERAYFRFQPKPKK